jgi:hypothetical protein
MGTRSTITINDENGKPLVNLYQQFDGYLSGVGADLKQAFGHTKIINGFGIHQQAGDYANGMGCLAAQIVAKFKPGLGGAYIVPVGQCEEFNYTLSEENGLVMVSVTSYDGVLFEGPLSEMPI